jgi:hypothetical protein
MQNVRIIKHEAVPKVGSFEVSFSDGMPSRYFYFDEIGGPRTRPGQRTREEALEQAEAFARAEQRRLDLGLGDSL